MRTHTDAHTDILQMRIQPFTYIFITCMHVHTNIAHTQSVYRCIYHECINYRRNVCQQQLHGNDGAHIKGFRASKALDNNVKKI